MISKIFENAMHSQLIEYFTSHKLLSNQQYGFRPNRSTELATLELMDRNINYMNVLKLIRETPLVELNRSGYTTIVQFSGHFKYTIINQYDPICTINNCHICGLP